METTIRIGTDVTDKSVKKGTGKDWRQWRKVLDKAGAPNWPRKQIVAYLSSTHELTPWWRQIVTTGYEIMIGKKIEGRNAKGEYSITVTKTMPLNAKMLWKLLNSDSGIAVWLKPLSKFKLNVGADFEREGGIYGEVRTIKAGQRIRLKWQDADWERPTIVQITVVPRPNEKSLLAIQHENLTNGRLRADIRAQWRQVAEELAQLKS